MGALLIQNATLVNEGTQQKADLLIEDGLIALIADSIDSRLADEHINAEGLYLLPGAIDDQVHFREPGLTHKADLHTESVAAVAGGITSFMEMPNTLPPATTRHLLEDKYKLAADKSVANYSFFIGATNDNLEEILATDPRTVCGIKIFMGSSTGNLLVDSPLALEGLFSRAQMLIATHCEDEETVKANEFMYRDMYGEEVPIEAHPLIRSHRACLLSSQYAIDLATRHNARLHILHISTAEETRLFRNDIPLEQKRITAEACVHHLTFCDEDYKRLGTLIKWNPAIKTAADRDAIFQAVLDDRIDVIATDHAPHTLHEKRNTYFKAPSGGPLVQHALPQMLEHALDGRITIEKVVQKMSHNPAILFQVHKRGFLREGYYADLVLVNMNDPWVVSQDNILYKCGWSPFEGKTFRPRITHTFINGQIAYRDGRILPGVRGMRLSFDR